MPREPDQIVRIAASGEEPDAVVGVVGDQVLTATPADVGKVVTVAADGSLVLAEGGGGASDHGDLTGLTDPDHSIAAVIGLQTALDGALQIADNLSDLQSTGTARTNLGVYSTAEVDALIAGLPSKAVSHYATAAALPASAYANGASGVGATLTGNANGPLTVDGQLVAAGNLILVQNQAAPAQNGPYVVTQPGVVAVSPFILTRRSDYDTATEMAVAATFPVDAEGLSPGATNDAKVFLSVTSSPFVVGTTGITFAQVGGVYTAGGGIQLSGNQFSLVDQAEKVSLSLADAAGDLFYATADNTWARLPKGTALQQLRMNAGATAPEWAAPSSSGVWTRVERVVRRGTGNIGSLSSTAKAAIDATNLKTGSITLAVGDRVRLRCSATVKNSSAGQGVGIDFLVDQPTSADVYVDAGVDYGTIEVESPGSNTRFAIVAESEFTATEAGVHVFTVHYVVSGGTLTVCNATSGQDDVAIQLSVDKAAA